MKVTNIIRILQNEINKGNIYISRTGNICSEDTILKEVKKEYFRKIDNDELDISISLSEYMHYKYNIGIKCEDVVELLKNKYGINYVSHKERRNYED